MMYSNNKHWAFNLETAEVISTSTGNALKRSVRWHQHYARKHGETKGVWVFAHGSQAWEKLHTKAQQVGAIKGW